MQRVEHVSRQRDAVRVCPVNPLTTDRLVCYAQEPPASGARFALVNAKGYEGTFEAESIEPSDQDDCRLGTAHEVQLAGAGLKNSQGVTLGVQGLEVGPAARVMLGSSEVSPSGRTGERVWLSLDLEGDDLPDMLSTAYDCQGPIDKPLAPAGKILTVLCIDYWLQRQGQWRKVNEDVFYNCR